MKLCASIQLFVTLLLSLGVTTSSFMVAKNVNVKPMTVLKALPENVEVCNFKDCKRAGGGPRLEKLVNSILEEKDLVDTIKVDFCECQGECGYGPNLVIDGKIKNFVKGRDAVIKALGIEEEEQEN